MYIDQMKKVISGYLNNLKTTQVTTGTVVGVNPLSIRINQDLLIPPELVWGSLKRHITEPWQIGMKLSLIRNEGGQSFTILEELTNIPLISIATITGVNPLEMVIEEGPLTLVEGRIVGNLKPNYKYVEDIGTRIRVIKNTASKNFYLLEEVSEG